VPAPGESGKNAIFELRYYRMRNSAQIQRTSDFLVKYYLPAAQRAGFGHLDFSILWSPTRALSCWP